MERTFHRRGTPGVPAGLRDKNTIISGTYGAREKTAAFGIDLGDAPEGVLQPALDVHAGPFGGGTGTAGAAAEPERPLELGVEQCAFSFERRVTTEVVMAFGVGERLLELRQARPVRTPSLLVEELTRRVVGAARPLLVARERQHVELFARALDEARQKLHAAAVPDGERASLEVYVPELAAPRERETGRHARRRRTHARGGVPR